MGAPRYAVLWWNVNGMEWSGMEWDGDGVWMDMDMLPTPYLLRCSRSPPFCSRLLPLPTISSPPALLTAPARPLSPTSRPSPAQGRAVLLLLPVLPRPPPAALHCPLAYVATALHAQLCLPFRLRCLLTSAPAIRPFPLFAAHPVRPIPWFPPSARLSVPPQSFLLPLYPQLHRPDLA